MVQLVLHVTVDLGALAKGVCRGCVNGGRGRLGPRARGVGRSMARERRRPPGFVVRGDEISRELGQFSLSEWTEAIGFQFTELGRDPVLEGEPWYGPGLSAIVDGCVNM